MTSLGLWYGGIQLYSVRFSRIRQRAVYNGPDYLYTRKEAYGTGYLNSTTTNFNITSDTQGNDSLALEFNSKYNLQFMQPRQTLNLDVGSDDEIQVIIPAGQDPDSGEQVDCQNGPDPIYFDLVSLWGNRTAMVEFGIAWNVVEGTADNPPPLLSNRWDQFHDYAQDQRLTITTVGRAIFRRDALLKNGTVADDYRQWILIPMSGETGFARTMQIGMAQDGLTLNYRTVDRQQTYDSPSTSVAHMNVRVMVETSKPGLQNLGKTTRFVQWTFDKIAWWADRKIGGAGEAFQGALDQGLALLAQTVVTLIVEIQGTPTSLMPDLVNAGLAVLNSKGATVRVLGGGRVAQIETDFDNRKVTISRSFSLAPAAATFNAAAIDGSTAGGGQELTSILTDTVSGLYITNVAKAPGQGTQLIGVGGPLINLMAQLLQAPLTDPGQTQTSAPEAEEYDQSDEAYQEEPKP